jgi:hypothetical protein
MIHPELSASRVAGLIGLHKFQNASEVFYELLSKNKEAGARIAEVERMHNRRAFHRVLQDVLKDGPVKDIVHQGLRSAQTTSNVAGVLADVEEQAKLLLDLRSQGFTPQVRDQIAREVRGAVSKQRGLTNENRILDTYEAQHELKVTERNTKTIKKNFGAFTLVGRCDGYVASENRIVDSKDRTRHWPTVPVYDEIQLRCYMNMYNATESELIERFPNGEVRHTRFTNDPEKWAAIQLLVERKVEQMNMILNDPVWLERVVFENTVCMNQNAGAAPPVRSTPPASLADL